MKLLLDEGLPRSTVKHLASVGIAAEHIGELGMSAAADSVILDAARERSAVVVTLDADFHRLLATSGAISPSVIRLRMQRMKGHQLAGILGHVVSRVCAELEAGALVSVTPLRIRVRVLPIRR